MTPTPTLGQLPLRNFVQALRWGAQATFVAFRYPAFGDIALQLVRLLARSLPVVAAVAAFSGAMLTVQAASSLALLGGGPLAGTIVGVGGIREVFPMLAMAALSARTGAEFASELGTMRVTQQIDALDVMGLDPMRLLVGPRVLAAILGAPACVLVADAAGLLGAFWVGTLQLKIDAGSLWAALASSFILPDIFIGMTKGLLLGWLVGIITTHAGLRAEMGPRGVGRATNHAVVRSNIAVCVVSLLFTYGVYGRSALQGG